MGPTRMVVESIEIRKDENTENIWYFVVNPNDRQECYDANECELFPTKEELLKSYNMKWIKIDRDENGFATEECLDKIFRNLPCVVCLQINGYNSYDLIKKNCNVKTCRENIKNHTIYTHYLPIPKLEV